MSMKWSLHCFVLSTCLFWGQPQPGSAQEVAEVSVIASTTFGEPLAKVLVTLKAIGATAQFKQYGESIRFPRVPFGFYDLEMQASGFNTRRERVGIFQSRVRFWFGLCVSPVHSQERSVVLGSINPQTSHRQDLWVRLVPRYSSDFIEDQVIEGRFRLAGIDPGQYTLMVFDKQEVILTKPVECFGKVLMVNLDLKQ